MEPRPWYVRFFGGESPRILLIYPVISLAMIVFLSVAITRVDHATLRILEIRDQDKEVVLREKIDSMQLDNLREFVIRDSHLIDQLLDYLAVLSTFSNKLLVALAWLGGVNVLIALWAIFHPHAPAAETTRGNRSRGAA